VRAFLVVVRGLWTPTPISQTAFRPSRSARHSYPRTGVMPRRPRLLIPGVTMLLPRLSVLSSASSPVGDRPELLIPILNNLALAHLYTPNPTSLCRPCPSWVSFLLRCDALLCSARTYRLRVHSLQRYFVSTCFSRRPALDVLMLISVYHTVITPYPSFWLPS
jgi:hypothetical protein